MPDNFFAILDDATIRRISLAPDIENSIRDVFVGYGTGLLSGKEEVEFDGNYKIDENEILFVSMTLTEDLTDMATNSIGIPILDLTVDSIKTLVWYEGETYYFQNFDNRKLLRNRNVIFYTNQTYNRLQENAFIIDNIVNALFMDGKFYFLSYANANKIFSLTNYYREATNDEVIAFGRNRKIAVADNAWFLENSNTVIRKQIALIQKNHILRNADTTKIKKSAKKCKLHIDLDARGKIVFPRDRKVCKDILTFLNEGFFLGLITGTPFKTNSKRPVVQTRQG